MGLGQGIDVSVDKVRDSRIRMGCIIPRNSVVPRIGAKRFQEFNIIQMLGRSPVDLYMPGGGNHRAK